MSLPTLEKFLEDCNIPECADALAKARITEKTFPNFFAFEPLEIEQILNEAGLAAIERRSFITGVKQLKNPNASTTVSSIFQDTKRNHDEALGLIIISEERLGKIIDKWTKCHVNLLRSPPSSGKTTLARILKNKLPQLNYTVYSISLSGWTPSKYPDLLNNPQTFNNFWKDQTKSEGTWDECIDNCKTPTAIIIDEAQALYGGASAYFWNRLKDLVDHPEKYPNLYILLLSMYDNRPSNPIAPNDPSDPSAHPPTLVDFFDAFGLESLRLTNLEFRNIAKNYIELHDDDGAPYEEPFNFSEDVLVALYNATYGHPHLIRRSLEFLREQYRRHESMLNSLISSDYFNAMKATRVFNWTKNWSPTPLDTQILRNAYETMDSASTFSVETRGGIALENALQNLKHSGLITNASKGRFQFAAPLVRIIMGQYLYSSHLSLRPSPSRNDFEKFLRLSIERMRPSELRNSLSHGNKKNSRLLERAWQYEWGIAASSALPHSNTISPDVGSVYGSTGCLDFYVNGALKWGVELMREGSKMDDHVGRFTPTGRYSKIPLNSWVIIDFRHKTLEPDRNYLQPDIWYALYEDDYSEITIIRQGKEDMKVVLRGDDPLFN